MVIARIAAGFALLAAGAAMLILPGPGLVTIAAGLALLSRDLRWARRLRSRLEGRLGRRESAGPVPEEA